MNKVILTGNLGFDATVGNHNGKSVINFNLAVSKKVNNETQTTWFRCSYWTDKTAVAPYLKKGGKVLVEGEVSLSTYGDVGNMKSSLDVRVNNVELLGGGQQQATQPVNNNQQPAAETADDLPF